MDAKVLRPRFLSNDVEKDTMKFVKRKEIFPALSGDEFYRIYGVGTEYETSCPALLVARCTFEGDNLLVSPNVRAVHSVNFAGPSQMLEVQLPNEQPVVALFTQAALEVGIAPRYLEVETIRDEDLDATYARSCNEICESDDEEDE